MFTAGIGKPPAVTHTEGFSLGDPSKKAAPLDTSDVTWGKAEQVVKSGVDFRKGSALVLTVENIKDGDTVVLKGGRKDGSNMVCRLDGIDAQETAKPWKTPPDPGQPYGEAAKTELMRLIDKREVNVTVTKSSDTYGREICQIDIQGNKNVNAEMVKAGAATLTERFWKDSDTSQQTAQREALRTFQKNAIDKKLGSFGLPLAQQVDPRNHRNLYKQ